MSSYVTPDRSAAPYVDPTPEATQPHVPEVGATSAPLKSAAFFIGAYCKEYNGQFLCNRRAPLFDNIVQRVSNVVS
jgi:NADH dehydrogenase (ubiquinone) 1 alpha subcomplex subunit 8